MSKMIVNVVRDVSCVYDKRIIFFFFSWLIFGYFLISKSGYDSVG